jgi:hypothetical protein
MTGLAAGLLAYGGLFSSALIASTLFPAQSELVLAGLLIAGKQPAWLLIVVATVGNVLGSAINWWLGRYLEHFRDRRWFPFKPQALERATGWYHRYGRRRCRLSKSRCANDSAACYAPHSHSSLSIGAVNDGCSVFSRDGTRQQLGRGDVVLIPAGEVHACNPENDGRWSYQMLYLDPAWVEGVVGEMGALDAVVLNRLPPELAAGAGA